MINKIYITFLLFITTVTATMAAAGIFRTEININNVNYVMYDNNTVQGTNGSTISGSPFANAASIILNGGFNKTFKDGGAGNICSGVLAYRVYLVGSTPPAFTDINLPFVSNDGGNNNQTWGTTGANISLPNSTGDYRIDFFYRATGSNSNSSACNETFFQSNSSNNFTLLYSVQAPLPVIFSSFNVVPEGQTVKIDWATAQEINNAYFEVDRSKDLQTWENVAQKEGAGNSKTGKNYSITDFNPQKGTNYYRLTQVDTDGTRSMFPRLRSAVLEVNPDIVLYPNPSDEVVRLSGINEDANVTIMDMTGALKIEKKVTRNDNTVKISTLAAGTYVLRVQDETATKIMKIVVNK